MHPDDIPPYRSRDSLFETISRLNCESDNLHDEILKLRRENRELRRFRAMFEDVVMETEPSEKTFRDAEVHFSNMGAKVSDGQS